MGAPAPKSDPSVRTDADLIAGVRAGDVSALGALYDRYSANLFGIAHRLLHSQTDAEDVVHDVFVGLPDALRRYEERSSLPAWLRTITARVALARLRLRARDSEAVDERHPAPRIVTPEDSITLAAAVKALPPHLRAVLVLKEIEGFSHREIAAMLDISVGASEVRLHRAMQALRRALVTKEDR